MSSGATTGLSELSRDELEKRVQELEQRVTELESLADIIDVRSPDEEDVALGDIWIAGEPIGMAIDKASKRSQQAIKKAEASEPADPWNRLDRSSMLSIHKMWIDLESGDTDNIPSKSARRAARLFGRFVRKGQGKPDQGVDPTYGTYSMTQPQAREILQDEQDPVDAVSKDAERAMKAAQRFSKVEDCDCETIRDCDHGLLVWDVSGSTNSLVGEKDRFNAAMEDVYGRDEDASESDDDSPEEPREPEDQDDHDETVIRDAADEELDALMNASRESSDTVVRTSEGSSSDAANTTD